MKRRVAEERDALRMRVADLEAQNRANIIVHARNALLEKALVQLRDYCLSEHGGPYVSPRIVNEICDAAGLARR